MKLKLLLSVLILYRSNFHNLHWNSKGKSFDRIHVQITDDYMGLMDKYIDIVGEMITRLGDNPPNLLETIHIIEESDKNIFVVHSNDLYDLEDVIKCSDIMLRDVIELIKDAYEEPEIQDEFHNVGIKATLEGMVDEFDIQYRYLNKRRMM